MMRSWTLTFDDLPPSANDRRGRHWRYLKKVADRWHTLVWAQVQQLAIPHLPSVRLSVTITRPQTGSRSGDSDNDRTRFKEVQDALVRCGIVDDDDPSHVTWTGDPTIEHGERGFRLLIEDPGEGDPPL